jgi:copper chaperone CopZ
MRLAICAIVSLSLSSVACTRESSDTENKTPTAAAKPAPLPAEPVAAEAQAEGEGSTCAGEGEMGGECGKEAGGCNKWDEAADQVTARAVPKEAVWKAFKVSGMTCGGCERRVIANIGKLDGVVGVEADAELGQVRIATASGDKSAADRASRAIGDLGYRVEGVL